MSNPSPFPEKLQSEYSSELFDVAHRRKNAGRLYRALNMAHLWRDNLNLLDVGTGTGLLISALGERAQTRIACDMRRKLYLEARPQIDNIIFVQSNGVALPFLPEKFDMVTCIGVIEEFPNWQPALLEMGRCVAPNGLLYLTVVNGRFLMRVYVLAEKLGFRIRQSWWAYAKSSMFIINKKPEDGLGVLDMAEWHFTNLTPYLIISQWSWLSILPKSILMFIANIFSPSYGYVWKKVNYKESYNDRK